MNELVATALGDAGIAWVQDYVACGPYSEGEALQGAVSTNVELSEGYVVALLPRGAADGVEVTNLDANVFAQLEGEAGRGAALGKLAAAAAVELARGQGGDLLICEAWVTRAGYEMDHSVGDGVVLSRDRVIFVGDSVLPWARVAEMTNEDVCRLVGDGLGLVSSVGLPAVESAREVDREDLNAIVRAARAILVSAYDSTSLVLWRPGRAGVAS